jgi:hypothetical protein
MQSLQERQQEKFPVAHEILRQLGSRMFMMMTGANSLTATDNSLSFKFKGSKRWKHMKIELTPMDVYTVTFSRVHGHKLTQEVFEDIYNEDLRPLFERETGLYTSL